MVPFAVSFPLLDICLGSFLEHGTEKLAADASRKVSVKNEKEKEMRHTTQSHFKNIGNKILMTDRW